MTTKAPTRRKKQKRNARKPRAPRPGVPAKWHPILLAIPGYDSIATAQNCRFDAGTASQALEFIQTCCRHVKGELKGEYFKLEPWEKTIVANLFGWKRQDGTRRYREVFIFVPRKNGKTTLMAAIVCYVMFTDHEPGAELYSAAADRDQASLVFEQVERMIQQEPEMYKRAVSYRSSRSIVYEAEGTKYKAISAEVPSKHGYNSHFVGIDELHAQPNRDLVDVLLTSTGSRRQPIVLHITTSDYDRESICNQKHDYASKVRDGIIEDTEFLPVIYEADREDDWTDPKVWAKANPNLGISIAQDYLERECKRAQEQPAYENTFKRLHLNIRTEQDVRWLPMEAWDNCAAPVDFSELRERPCFAGLDLSSKTDITAFVLLWPPDESNLIYHVLPYFWIPGENAHKRERRDRVPYVTWANQGYIELTEGNVIDYEVIRKRINELSDQHQFRVIGFDPWNAAQMDVQLAQDGFDPVPMRQGFHTLSNPTKELEKLVLGGELAHAGNPVLRWMASNVTVRTDANANLAPNKEKSIEKIDGIVALIMALGVSMEFGVEKRKSIYETRGLLMI